MQAVILLALLLLTTLLLLTERLRADLVAMLMLATLVVTGVLEPARALSGFSDPATVAVACLFVLGAGLKSSGVLQYVGDRLLQRGPAAEGPTLGLLALLVSPISAFVTNTATVAIFLPVVLRACQGRAQSPSRYMMPLSFLTMLGGTCTLIGTSTNVLVSSIASGHGLAPFGMFEMTAVGVAVTSGGWIYLVALGRHLIPDRIEPRGIAQGFQLDRYLSEVVVLEGSVLVGRSIVEAGLGERYSLEVVGHVRDKVMRTVPDTHGALAAGDILLVQGPATALVGLRDAAGIAMRPGRHPDSADLRSADSALVEAVVTPNSELDGRTLKGVDFRNRFGATTLAIRRHGEDIREKIGHVRLQVGDELLVLVPHRNVSRLRREAAFQTLQEVEVPVVKPWVALTAVSILIGVVALVASGLYALVEAAVVGAVVMVLTGCVPARKAYDDIDWSMIFLLAGLIPLSSALETTGAAAGVARGMLSLLGNPGPTVALGAFFVLAVLLTGFMSNVATAALLAPLAIGCATGLGVEARPFLFALVFAASAAFFTPIGYQTNLLVYGPGGYRFSDFVRVGGPLTLIYTAVAVTLIPRLFPF